MATHVFKFVVSDVELTPEQQEHVGRAVSQAGVAAVADLTPADAVDFRGGPNWLWRGIPPVDVLKGLEAYVAEQVGAGD